MSKFLKAISLSTLPILVILQFFTNSSAQRISVTITIDPSERTASIKGKFNDPEDLTHSRNFSFRREYAGVEKLDERITGVELTDSAERHVGYRQFAPGELLAEGLFAGWRYDVDIAPPANPSASAHVSWIRSGEGIIFLNDLMPLLSGKGERMTANVKFELPTGWQIYSTEKKSAEAIFESVNIEKAVFLIGKGLRERTVATDRPSMKIVMGGSWQFSDTEAEAAAREIFGRYRGLFGAESTSQAQIGLMRFPVDAGAGSWEASTVGSTVTILSSDMPFKTQALQRLHEQLRHEIFHLWIPNAVNLKGSYDWFYEGFALYLSLKTGVLMNRIRFEDLLDTLSRAYMIDRFQTPRPSLIDASRNRWQGGNTTVYARGMIVAFLCDLAMLKSSNGKTDVSNFVREIFEKYRFQQPAIDGNEAVLGVLKQNSALASIAENYVKGNSLINWSEDLAGAGIIAEEKNSATVLRTIEKPNGRQKAMLDKLGYNSWRKLTERSK